MRRANGLRGRCVLYTVRVIDKGGIGYAPTKAGNNYGATACNDRYKPGIGRDYTQKYPPNDTVSWEMDRLALWDAALASPPLLITEVFNNEGNFICNNIPIPPAPACAPGDLNKDCTDIFPHNILHDAVNHYCPVNAPPP